MRILIIMLFLAMNASAQKDPIIRTMIVKTQIYCDHCVQCETCGEHFNKKLLRIKGIQMVALDEVAMTVRVVYNSKKINDVQVREAIAGLGYDADGIKADPAAYASLDGCCKKE